MARRSATVCRVGDRTRVVLSHHDFAGVPADLADRARAMRAAGADVIVKIAVNADATRRLPDAARRRDRARRRRRDRDGTGGAADAASVRGCSGRAGRTADARRPASFRVRDLIESVPRPDDVAGARRSTPSPARRSRIRRRRRCTTPRSPRPASTPSTCRSRPTDAAEFLARGRGDRRARRERDGAAQDAPCSRAAYMPTRSGRRIGAVNTLRRARRPAGRAATSTSPDFSRRSIDGPRG